MGSGCTQDCVECSKLLLGQRGIRSPSMPRIHISVFGPFCLVPPSPLLRGGPGGCQRHRPGVGSGTVVRTVFRTVSTTVLQSVLQHIAVSPILADPDKNNCAEQMHDSHPSGRI